MQITDTHTDEGTLVRSFRCQGEPSRIKNQIWLCKVECLQGERIMWSWVQIYYFCFSSILFMMVGFTKESNILYLGSPLTLSWHTMMKPTYCAAFNPTHSHIFVSLTPTIYTQCNYWTCWRIMHKDLNCRVGATLFSRLRLHENERFWCYLCYISEQGKMIQRIM